MEMLPLRHMPGSMGVIDIGNFAQTVQWGDLATFVSFETRISYRSRDPTLNSNTLSDARIIDFAEKYDNVEAYEDPDSEEYAELQIVAAALNATLWDPEYTMIGENINILSKVFSESKAYGVTWQIWAANTALGPAVKANFFTLADLVEDPDQADQVRDFTDLLKGSSFFRRYVAATLQLIPWNRDGHPGFAHEKAMIMDILKEHTNNPVTLSGDLHDHYAWTLYDKGHSTGEPTAINLVAGGVTSPGWGPFLSGTFAPLADVLGSMDDVFDLLNKGDEAANPGMPYYDLHYKGFFAVKLTKVRQQQTIYRESVFRSPRKPRSGSLLRKSILPSSLVLQPKTSLPIMRLPVHPVGC